MIGNTAEALEALAKALTIVPPQDGSGEGDDGEQEQQDDGKDQPPEGEPEPDKKFEKAMKPSRKIGPVSEEIKAIIRDDRDGKDPPPNPRGPSPLVLSEISPEYQIAPGVTDRIARADVLMQELRVHIPRAREQLDTLVGDNAIVGRLATKLMRLIMAQQTRAWSFDQEDGMLDPARLARIVSSPALPAAYRVERESDFKDTTVTLLLDNSGSMDGAKMDVAMAVSTILAQALERCGVGVEVLGWTTKGVSPIHPEVPSRFDNLLHIVYKDASVPFRRVRDNFCLMTNSSFTAQNVDGEALMWAYNRLVTRPQQRRILMVLSDGEPCAFTGDRFDGYLSRHLKKVIKEIETRGDVELLAVGALHNVTRWYRHAITVRDLSSIGPVLMQEMTKLFDPREQKKRVRTILSS